MSDDWNLKGAWHNGYYSMFEHEVFETLRQKLIEDIKKTRFDFYDELARTELYKIINKRFGVEK